jgi:hypothetical protein
MAKLKAKARRSRFKVRKMLTRNDLKEKIKMEPYYIKYQIQFSMLLQNISDNLLTEGRDFRRKELKTWNNF